MGDARRDSLLAEWHADPRPHASAYAAWRRALRSGGRKVGDGRGLPPDLQALVARFWAGRPVVPAYQTLVAQSPPGEPSRALVELVYGQLLMSRKLTGARGHLEAGFDMARSWFSARDYFTVLKRHQLLARLPLTEAGSAPRTLADLLTEARVVARLEGTPGPARRGPVSGREDTLG